MIVLFYVGLILIFSGAVGNLIDRVLYKEVIDFIDFFYKGSHWPAFNIADACITIGDSFMIYDLFFGYPKNTAIFPKYHKYASLDYFFLLSKIRDRLNFLEHFPEITKILCFFPDFKIFWPKNFPPN